ncbi:MAG: hypothetical protein KF802_12165 [Bdellovibrionaceae bacterium]|nr:hypothetical protein [Pseudobdellovibrionaceae bacterium]MBX3032870.1 hypothetical protein [Pseudobdellovibrionaceae bacterium]
MKMKSLRNALFAVLTVCGLNIAQANDVPMNVDDTARVRGPLYTCSLDGYISGGSVAIIIGGQVLSGPGYIVCSQSGRRGVLQIPVTFRLAGAGIGLDLTAFRNVHVVTAGIGVSDPRFFLRSFGVGASAGVSLIAVGVGFDTAVRVSDGGFGFDLGLQGADVIGLGARLYGTVFSITAR